MCASISSTRNTGVDLIKIIAMAVIVSLHSSGTLLSDNRPGLTWTIFCTGVIAVPLFLMASGYLLLGRPLPATTLHYALTKIGRIFRFLLIFTLAVYAVAWLFFGYRLSYPVALWHAWNGGGLFFVLWFLFTLAILYLFTPPINRLWYHKQAYAVTTGFLIMIMGVLWAINLTTHFQPTIPNPLCLWIWLAYFILGGLMHRVNISHRAALIAIVPLFIATLFQMYLTGPLLGTAFPEFHYGSPLAVALCSAIFIACTTARARRTPLIDTLSALFLPVFLLHPYIIDLLRLLTPWTFPGGAIWLSLATFITTVSLSILLRRIPPLRHILSI